MTREQKLATFTALTKLVGIKTGLEFEESQATARLLFERLSTLTGIETGAFSDLRARQASIIWFLRFG